MNWNNGGPRTVILVVYEH